jgi:hypothetical protein
MMMNTMGRPSGCSRFVGAISLVLLSGLVAAGCGTARATQARHEPLVVPQPPPRIIAPAPEPESPPRPVIDPEPVPPLPRAARPAPQRTDTKPTEPAPDTPAATAAPAATPAPTSGAAPELRTVEAPDDQRATKQVRETLDRANRTLGTVDYRNLSQAAKLQYDMAKRFIEQAEEAVKAKNYTAALLMSEKADTIAKELSGR